MRKSRYISFMYFDFSFPKKGGGAKEDLRPLTFMENIVGIYRSLDSAFSANLSHSIEDGVGKTENFDKCSMQRRATDVGYETPNKDGVDLLRSVSHKQIGASKESRNRQIIMSRADQASLSPPSYGDTKVSDNDSEHSLANFPAKGAGKRNSKVGEGNSSGIRPCEPGEVLNNWTVEEIPVIFKLNLK
ncbi:hypothetical protein ES319_D07G233100v1 [Gossypium barbadense]|uniref:Uncharacterized protein n=1 Tax=Gossypium barbadense TaxID=3634 RepID=A0A5J5QXF2_GOSBA|nr:hypothetical protein ES319_D07G233100v1 [Gossypium barbadense]